MLPVELTPKRPLATHVLRHTYTRSFRRCAFRQASATPLENSGDICACLETCPPLETNRVPDPEPFHRVRAQLLTLIFARSKPTLVIALPKRLRGGSALSLRAVSHRSSPLSDTGRFDRLPYRRRHDGSTLVPSSLWTVTRLSF